MTYNLTKVRDDLKHIYNTSTEQRVKDFVAGMILEINKELVKKSGLDKHKFMLEQIFLAQDVS